MKCCWCWLHYSCLHQLYITVGADQMEPFLTACAAFWAPWMPPCEKTLTQSRNAPDIIWIFYIVQSAPSLVVSKTKYSVDLPQTNVQPLCRCDGLLFLFCHDSKQTVKLSLNHLKISLGATIIQVKLPVISPLYVGLVSPHGSPFLCVHRVLERPLNQSKCSPVQFLLRCLDRWWMFRRYKCLI